MRSVKSFMYTVFGVVIFVIVPILLVISNHIEKSMPGNDHEILNVMGNATVQYQIDRLLASDDGSRSIYRKKSDRMPLKKGMKIGPGAYIRSEKGASLDLRLNDDIGLRIKEDSLLKMGAVAAKNTAAELTLKRGRILCRVTRKDTVETSHKTDLLKVSTPTAAATITGTSFSIDYVPEKRTTQVQVLEGRVDINPIKNPKTTFQVTHGKELRICTSRYRPVLNDIPSNELAELLETKELNIEKTLQDRWHQSVMLVTDSPLYKKILIEITKYEMKVFIRAIIHLAPLRWTNKVPPSLKKIELEEGDYKDPWNTDYYYDPIESKQAVLISAGPDRVLHTSDDIFMSIRL